MFKVFFKCCYVFTFSPVSSSFGNVENNIQFSAAFVCPFPCGKHGLFPPCVLQTSSQLSFSCLLPCQRRHWWYHSKSRNKGFAVFSSYLVARYCIDFTSSDLAHLLIHLFRKSRCFPHPPSLPLPTQAEGADTWNSFLETWAPIQTSQCLRSWELYHGKKCVDPVFFKIITIIMTIEGCRPQNSDETMIVWTLQ